MEEGERPFYLLPAWMCAMATGEPYVRFKPKSRYFLRLSECPFWANSGHRAMPQKCQKRKSCRPQFLDADGGGPRVAFT
jgi:hypothetical protein